MPMIGERLHINLQLYDGDTNKYVRALFFNADGIQFASVDLTNIGEGLYSNSSVTMPATDQVKVVYKVYTSAAYTNLSQLHAVSMDVFDLETVDGRTVHCDLIGLVEEAPELIAYISQSTELFGEIENCNTLNGSPPC
jgi:hypothetical protein